MIKRILFILVLCLLVLSPIVSAETLTGTLASSGTLQFNYNTTYVGAPSPDSSFNTLLVRNMQNTKGVQAYIHFDQAGYLPTYTNATQTSGTAPFQAKIGSVVVGNGTFGYQRLYSGSTETTGYQYLVFSDWDIKSYTGNQVVSLNINYTALGQTITTGSQGTFGSDAPTGAFGFAHRASESGAFSGYQTVNYDATFSNSYTATKPSGIGITGSVTKGGYSSRIYIINAYNNAPITSELSTNVNNYNFSTNAETIRICAYDSYGAWHNSSNLFTSSLPPITPTPTSSVSPTPTGAGYGGDTDGTFYIRDGLNQTLLTNTYIELEYDEGFGEMTIAGYTDGTGKIVFQALTDGVYYTAKIWRSGYQFGQYNFQATPIAFSKTFYLYPTTTSTETIPQQINVTVRAMDKTTYAPVSGATVKIENMVTGQSTFYLTTNATGYVVFMGFPNSANIGGTITKSGYVQQIWSIPYQVSTNSYMPDSDVTQTELLTPNIAVTPTGTIITPTPTPITIDKLILTATPDSINLGSSTSLVGSSSNATRLTYAGGLRRTSFYVNVHPATYPFDWNMIGQFENVNATYWKFRPNMSATFNTPTTASPLTLVNTPTSNGLITYSFNAYDTSGNAIAQSATDDVLVGGGAGGGSLTISASAYDVSNGDHLSNFQLNITDDASGVVTEYGNVSYEKEITLPRGNTYTLRASKEGYIYDGVTSGIKQFTVPTNLNIEKGDFGAIFNVPMFPIGSVILGNTTVSVRVYDISTYYPLPNVQLVNSYAPTDIKYTIDASAISWTIPQNTGYTIKAIKDGYCTVTESKNTSTNSYQYVPIYMKYGACTGTTPTPTPTGTATPTITPIGGWGNLTGGATVCGQMPTNATVIDILKNGLACNGLRDEQSQNLGIAMLIILFAAIILGRVAKGVGVLAGVIAGTVLSTVAGFLPFWIIIVVIIIAGLVFAGKVFWSSGN